MYRFYLDTFAEALARLNSTLESHWQPRDFHLHLPRYVSQRDPWRQRLLYAAHVARDYTREAAALGRGALRLLSRKLRWCRS
jgi:hypothetical protein